MKQNSAVDNQFENLTFLYIVIRSKFKKQKTMTTESKLSNSFLSHPDSALRFNLKNPPVLGIRAILYDHVNSFQFINQKYKGLNELIPP
jgi:hypothetical protein